MCANAERLQLAANSSELGRLSLPEKQELIYEAAKKSGCREALETWKRKDLLQLLCLEMGKERKYTGIPKSKMVDHLLRLVSLKDSNKEDLNEAAYLQPSIFSCESLVRRQRKGGHPVRLPTPNSQASLGGNEKVPQMTWLCRNSACKAQLTPGVPFCRRCSCCICHRFDDNKDPSLWIVCTQEPLAGESECGLSCHVECALDQDLAGVVYDGGNLFLDGSYRCESCGKVSDLIGFWKKQLFIAKDARRVDILCHRLSLCHRLLNGTSRYKEIHSIIDKATKKLESEVGSITEGSSKLVRGIVNRLSSGAHVQELVGLALDKAESLHVEPEQKLMEPKHPNKLMEPKHQDESIETLCSIVFEDVSSVSIVVSVKESGHLLRRKLVGYKLWHRKSSELNYPDSTTCVIPKSEGKAFVSNLQACTEYAFQVVPFSERGDEGRIEALCFTKSTEAVQRELDLQLPLESPFNVAANTQATALKDENTENVVLHASDDLATNFKVRDLGRALHTAWGKAQQPVGAVEGVNAERGRISESGNQGEHETTVKHIRPALNVLLSHVTDTSIIEEGVFPPRQWGADASSVADRGSRPRLIGRQWHHLIPEELNIGSSGGRVTVEVGHLDATSEKSPSREKDSSVLIKENYVMQSLKECLLLQAEGPNTDEASDPGILQIVRGAETDMVSPVASGSLKGNGIGAPNATVARTDDLESNGQGESWAVQVCRGGNPIQMEPPTGITRKRPAGKAHNCYGMMNGCTGASSDNSVCATKSYEFCVKMIRWLECEGHLKDDFRMKFLTWFSLRATDHEKRVVSVFIDTLQDTPASLAGQLMDTFAEIVFAKRHQVVPNGFCNRLWH